MCSKKAVVGRGFITAVTVLKKPIIILPVSCPRCDRNKVLLAQVECVRVARLWQWQWGETFKADCFALGYLTCRGNPRAGGKATKELVLSAHNNGNFRVVVAHCLHGRGAQVRHQFWWLPLLGPGLRVRCLPHHDLGLVLTDTHTLTRCFDRWFQF